MLKLFTYDHIHALDAILLLLLLLLLLIMPKNHWARIRLNSNGQSSHRRTSVPAKQRKGERMHRRWSGGGASDA